MRQTSFDLALAEPEQAISIERSTGSGAPEGDEIPRDGVPDIAEIMFVGKGANAAEFCGIVVVVGGWRMPLGSLICSGGL
jgi:hypothetical protein